MSKHTVVVEVEDRLVRILISAGTGRSLNVESASTVRLEEAGPRGVAGAVRRAMEGRTLHCPDLFVLVSDRRIVSGQITRSRQPRAGDLRDLLRRHALEVGLFSADEELVIGYAERRRRHTWSAFYEAVPKEIVEGLLAPMELLGFESVHVASIESVLAAAVAGSERDSVAVVRVRGQRALLTIAAEQRPLGTRSIKLPFAFERLGTPGETVAETLGPLAMEIVRSLEFFGEQGLPAPQQVVLFGDFDATDLGLEMCSDMIGLPVSVGDHPALAALPSDLTPRRDWLVSAIVLQKRARQRINWLVQPRARSSAEKVASMAALVFGVCAIAGGILLTWLAGGEAAHAAVDRKLELKVELTELEARLQQLQADSSDSEAVTRARLLTDLDRGRVSTSRLCAALATHRPPQLRLDRINLEAGSLELTGIVQTESRLDAIRCFGELDRSLKTVFGSVPTSGRVAEPEPGSGIPFTWKAGSPTAEVHRED